MSKNKKELEKTLNGYLVRATEHLNILKELSKIDMSKFDGKKVTKRITNEIEKSGKLHATLNGEFYGITLWWKESKLNYNNKIFNVGKLHYEPKINGWCNGIFNTEMWNNSLIELTQNQKKYVSELKNDIKHFDKYVARYNKIVEMLVKFDKETPSTIRHLFETHSVNSISEIYE